MSDELEVAVVSSRKALECVRNSSMCPTTDEIMSNFKGITMGKMVR
jgi:hypothetical protein